MESNSVNRRAKLPENGDNMIRKELRVAIAGGIHAVPTGKIVSIVREYGVTGQMEYGGRQADITNCLRLMMLHAGEGAVVTARLEGEREAEAMDALANYLENNIFM